MQDSNPFLEKRGQKYQLLSWGNISQKPQYCLSTQKVAPKPRQLQLACSPVVTLPFLILKPTYSKRFAMALPYLELVYNVNNGYQYVPTLDWYMGSRIRLRCQWHQSSILTQCGVSSSGCKN